METPEVVDEYIDDVTSPTVLYTVVGVAGASVLATAFAFIPFDVLPLGNVIRTGALLGLGAYVINWGQDQFNPGYESMANVAGGLLFTAGFVTAVASTTAWAGIQIPGMSKLQELLSPSASLGAEGLGGGAMAGGTGIMSGIDDEVNTLPQQGSGRVIGQATLTMSTSDIKNAEEYEWDFIPMTEDMANRYPASDMIASVQEQAPLGHGVTQKLLTALKQLHPVSIWMEHIHPQILWVGARWTLSKQDRTHSLSQSTQQPLPISHLYGMLRTSQLWNNRLTQPQLLKLVEFRTFGQHTSDLHTHLEAHTLPDTEFKSGSVLNNP